MNDVTTKSSEKIADKGLVYETPELIDRGEVSKGTDSGYS